MASSSRDPGPKPTPYLATMTDSREASLKKSCLAPQYPLEKIPGQLNGAPRPRLLTVDEALQYSPLSSVVPFDSSEILNFVRKLQDTANHIITIRHP